MTGAKDLDEDIIKALKGKDKVTALVLRSFKSALHNEAISKKQTAITADTFLRVLKREIKKRKEAIAAYQPAQRHDLIAAEEQELKILEKYMPPQLAEAVINEAIKEALSSLPEGERNFGQVMKTVMAKLPGQADGKLVSDLVKKQI